jgi:FixJ family two-component response regulator
VPAPPIYVAVVDDDEELCRSFGRLLRAAGFQPITYASAEALLADTKHPQFDCLVFDIELGGMSGIELAKRLLANGRSTPCIFITAHEELSARARAEVTGAAAYFRKTDSGADVLDVIRRCVSAGGHG